MRFANLVKQEFNKKIPEEKKEVKYNLYGLVLKGDGNGIDKMVETLLVCEELGDDFDKIKAAIGATLRTLNHHVVFDSMCSARQYLIHIGDASEKLVKAVCGDTAHPVYIVPKHLLPYDARTY